MSLLAGSGGLFENCSRHFAIEHNFRECVNTTEQCQLIQDVSTAYSILKWFGFYSSAFICFLVVLVDSYCLLVTIRMLPKLREETRKRYVCVLIRLSSSILVAVCIVTVQSTIFIDFSFRDSFTFYAIFFVVYDFSIFSLLGSFVGVAVSTYFGVMRPMVYRDKFTLKTTYCIAAVIWILSILIAIPVGLFQAADTIEGPVRCDSSTCHLLVKWLVFSITSVILLSALSTLTFVTISLYWHHYKSRKMGNLVSSASDHGRSRLAWTTGILVSLCFVELIPTGLLIGFEEHGFLDSCDNFYRANHLIVPALVSSFETFIGTLAFFLDPIINFFFDRHISREVASQWESAKKFFSSSDSSDLSESLRQ